MATGRFEFPSAAVGWLTAGSERHAPMLVLSATPKVPRLLADAGFDVVVAVRDQDAAPRFAAVPGIRSVVARAEALPFATYGIGTVVAYQSLNRFAPGLAMPELARVLHPQGHIAVCYFVRDDSVPWVKRLVAMMREINPNAMSSDDLAQHQALTTSKYFPNPENKDFRVWMPISRTDLLAMIARQPEVGALSTTERNKLLDTAGNIYDTTANGGELRLPYQLRCWRAGVDHAEFTRPVRLADAGLIISL
ncbi:MAG: class I SAM-dependent methyltransferase [Propionibacteriaceae bacterium]|jgi:SAM-dependent methyltransferase|nr:class I SAM-dependent methyltransferase [Propionibacteriaceae bacterium]